MMLLLMTNEQANRLTQLQISSFVNIKMQLYVSGCITQPDTTL